MRRLACLSLALIVNLGLFQFMASLIASHRLGTKPVLHAHLVDFVRLPEPQEPPPPRRPRQPPPVPTPPKVSSTPTAPQETYGNVRRLPVPELALKVEVPLATSVKLEVPKVPSLLVEGEPSPAAKLQVPSPAPRYLSASELVAIVRTPPLYPPEARSRRIEGKVVVEFTVTETGEVKDPRIVEATPPGVFDQAVLRAVRQWRFQPKEKDGKPVAVLARQPLEFRLRR